MIDHSWTLFLDRDGVINERVIGGYVETLKQFFLKKDFLPAMHYLRPLFSRIFVVTNQQGVGKGIMTREALFDIHQYLQEKLHEEHLFVDAIYSCPHLAESQCECRKPAIGLALQARKEFPEVDFENSIMVGDTLSDILFGKRCGMKTVLIGDALPGITPEMHAMPDYFCNDLLEFVHLII